MKHFRLFFSFSFSISFALDKFLCSSRLYISAGPAITIRRERPFLVFAFFELVVRRWRYHYHYSVMFIRGECFFSCFFFFLAIVYSYCAGYLVPRVQFLAMFKFKSSNSN